MASLEERIIAALEATNRHNMPKLIAYMKNSNFFNVRSGSHDGWIHGTAQHSWRVFQYSLFLKNNPKRLHKFSTAEINSVSDDSIAIAGLLHDLGKTISLGNHAHYSKQIIIKDINLEISQQEIEAIRNHSHPEKVPHNVLADIISTADNWASGTTWNGSRYINGLSQYGKGSSSSIPSLRLAAIDRTYQILHYGVYLDYHYNLNIAELSRNITIKYNTKISRISSDNQTATHVVNNRDTDYLEVGRKLKMEDPTNDLCLCIFCSRTSPGSGIRTGVVEKEVDLYICSNLLLALYKVKNRGEHHRYTFELKEKANETFPMDVNSGNMYISNLQIIRDAEVNGLQLVAPWHVNVAMVPRPHKYDIANLVNETSIKAQLEHMLRLAYKMGNRRIIISLNNPSDSSSYSSVISRVLIDSVLQSSEFINAFKEIQII